MKKYIGIFSAGFLAGILLALITMWKTEPAIDALAIAPVMEHTQTSNELDIAPIYTVRPSTEKKDSSRTVVEKKRRAGHKSAIPKTANIIAKYIPPSIQMLTAKPLIFDRRDLMLSGYTSSRIFYSKYAISTVIVFAPVPADSIRNILKIDYAAWYRDQHKNKKDKSFFGITQRDLIVGLSVFGITALAFTAARN